MLADEEEPEGRWTIHEQKLLVQAIQHVAEQYVVGSDRQKDNTKCNVRREQIVEYCIKEDESFNRSATACQDRQIPACARLNLHLLFHACAQIFEPFA